MIKNIINRAIFGFVLGMAIGNLIAAYTGYPNLTSQLLNERTGSWQIALLVQSLLSGIIGTVSITGMLLYKVERLSLGVSMIVHYCMYMVVFIPSAIFLGWIVSLTDLLIMVGILTVMHVIIFLIMCAYYRMNVKKLNELQKQLLSQMKQTEKKDMGVMHQ